MNKSESIKNLAMALHKAQSEMRGAKKEAENPFFKSMYATLSEVIDVARGPLQDNGLSFSQFPISKEPEKEMKVVTEKRDGTKINSFIGYIGVETILMHESGEWISQELLLACDKQDPQAYGSAITYARRYALQAILGIPSEDDDANHATFTATQPIRSVSPHGPSTFNNKVCGCGATIKDAKYSQCYDCFSKG